MKFFRKLTNLGIQEGTPVYEGTRIRLLNSLTLIGIIFFFGYVIFNIYNGVYKQAIIEVIYILVVSIPTLVLSAKRHHFIARNYLSISTLLLFIFISWITISTKRYTDAENVLFLYAMVVAFLHDKKRWLFGLLGFISLELIKYHKWKLSGNPISGEHVALFINYGAIYIGIFWIVGVFISNIEHLTKNELRIKEDHELDKELKSLLRSMVDSLPIFIALIDSEGRYILVNALYSKSFGRSVEEVEGKQINEILDSSDLDSHLTYFKKAINGEIANFEEENETSHFIGAYIPVMNEDDTVKYCSVHAVDISVVKKAEKELIISNQTKDRLFGIISHDLRSPFMQLQSLLAVKEFAEPKEVVKHLNSLEERFSNLLFTIDNLLNWSRTQLNGFKAQPSSFELTKIVDDTKMLVLEKENEKGITISHQYDQKWDVKADVEHIRIAIRNILSNAVKFSHANSAVEINYSSHPEYIEICISDSGVGISKEQIETIEAGMINSSKPGTAGERGSGMGLTLCEALFKENHCNMSIESKEGKGTSVSIHIPLDQ